MKHLIIAATMALAVTAPGYAQTSGSNVITVEHAWARATPKGAKTAAAYLTLINKGTASDRLLGASTPIADKVQFHSETNDNGVMKMRQLSTIEVDPGMPITFKPGAIHVMIVGLKQQLKEGQTFPLALDFEKAGKVDVMIPIAKAGAMGDHDMNMP